MKQSFLIPPVFTPKVFSTFLAVIACLAFFPLFISSASAETEVPDAYSLTASIRGQGSISPAGSFVVSEGSRKSFVFDTDVNHRLADVLVDGVSVGSIDAFSFENISASHTLEAIFESDAATLTATAGGTDIASTEKAAGAGL